MTESESILHHYESHRGFNAKARQVLLEPLAPFAVTEKKVHAGSSSNPSSPIAPHRGFNPKAREVLICRNAAPLQPFKLNLMSTKSNSDFDLRRRLLHTGGCILPKHGNGSVMYDSSTKSTASVASVADTTSATFDEIGDHLQSKASRAKAHVLLGDIGKTRSAGDFFVKQRKHLPLIRTFQQDNIMKLPSVDSDVDNASHLRQLAHRSDSEESMKDLIGNMDAVNLRQDRYEVRREKETTRPHDEHLTQGGKSDRVSSWLLDS